MVGAMMTRVISPGITQVGNVVNVIQAGRFVRYGEVMLALRSAVLKKLPLVALMVPALFFLGAYYDTPAGMRHLFLQMAYERFAYLGQ